MSKTANTFESLKPIFKDKDAPKKKLNSKFDRLKKLLKKNC